MIKQLSIVAALTLLLFSAGIANAASDTSSIDAEIITAITITNTVGLQFGQIVPGASAGVVTVTPLGVRSSPTLTLAGGTTATAASFDVAGAPSAAYTIELPTDTDVVLTGPGTPGTDMAVTGFTGSPAAGIGSGLLSVTGTQTLTVGAALHVAAAATQTVGAYSSTFTAIVTYD